MSPLLAALFIPMPIHAVERSWDGGGRGDFWTDAANWTGPIAGGAPVPGDDLRFPAGAPDTNNTNDYAAGTDFNSITCSGAGYVVNGNQVALTTGLNITHGAGSTNVGFDIGLNASQSFTVSQAGALLNLIGDVSLGFRTLTVAGEGNTIVWGNISSTLGTGRLTKTGGGTLVVVNSPSYGGNTTVNGGVLRVDGGLDNSAVIVNNTGTLRGDGPVVGLTVNTGGTVSPGTLDTDILEVTGNLALDAGATFNVRLNGTAAGTNYDRIRVTGAVTCGGALNVTTGFTAPVGTVFTIIENDGTDDVTGRFTGLPENAVFSVSGRPFRISYGFREGLFGRDVNDVTIEAIPALSVWDGEGAPNNFWSQPLNWVGNVLPLPGDDIQFANPGPGTLIANNDFPAGQKFGSIILAGGNIKLEGHDVQVEGGIEQTQPGDVEVLLPMTLAGGLNLIQTQAPQQYDEFFLRGAITLSASQTFNVGSTGTFLRIYGQVNVGSHSLRVINEGSSSLVSTAWAQVTFFSDLSGTGTLRKQGAGRMGFLATNACAQTVVDGGTIETHWSPGEYTGLITGDVTVNAGCRLSISGGSGVGGVTGDTTVTAGGVLSGLYGELGNVDIAGGTFVAGLLHVNGNFTMSGGAVFSTRIYAAPGSPDPYRIFYADVDGSVALNGASLDVQVENNTEIPPGEPFDLFNYFLGGPAGLTGTFTGLPNLSRFASGGHSFRVQYSNTAMLVANEPFVWDGTGAGVQWMTAGNWNPDFAPLPGSGLTFPDGVSERIISNDFPAGTDFRRLTFQRNSYIIGGNALDVVEGIFNEVPSGPTVILAPLGVSGETNVANASELRLGGRVSGTFRKTGPGVLHLSGNEDNAAIIDIREGRVDLEKSGAIALSTATVGDGTAAPVLRLRADEQFPDAGTVAVKAPARFDLNGHAERMAGVSGDGTVELGDIFGSAGSLTVTNGGFDGTITGLGSLTKTGNLTFFLRGSHNFLGTTTINAGQLRVDGSIAVSPIRIEGGVLSGDGQVAAINGISGVLAPGTGSPGFEIKLRCGNVTLNPATTFRSLLTDVAPGFENQKLSVTGTVNLGGCVLDLDRRSSSLTPGAVFILIENDASDAITGTFGGLPQGAVFEQLGLRWQISYAGGDGNDVAVTLTAVLPPVINSFSVTPSTTGSDTIEIEGSGIAGATYRLEATTDLVNWTPFSFARIADMSSGALEWLVLQPAAVRRCYRMRAQ